MRKWVSVPGTNNWQYDDDELGMSLRYIAVRTPYMNEPDGIRYVVSGAGHEHSKHYSLSEAMAAAEASLDSQDAG